jgi:predicted small metal-binding protein
MKMEIEIKVIAGEYNIHCDDCGYSVDDMSDDMVRKRFITHMRTKHGVSKHSLLFVEYVDNRKIIFKTRRYL